MDLFSPAQAAGYVAFVLGVTAFLRRSDRLLKFFKAERTILSKVPRVPVFVGRTLTYQLGLTNGLLAQELFRLRWTASQRRARNDLEKGVSVQRTSCRSLPAKWTRTHQEGIKIARALSDDSRRIPG